MEEPAVDDIEWRTYSMELWRRFCMYSTHQGLGRAVIHRGPARFIWVVLIIVATFATAIHMGKLVEQYMTFRVAMSLEYDKEPLVFPAITVCPSVRYSIFGQGPNELKFLEYPNGTASPPYKIEYLQLFSFSRQFWQSIIADDTIPVQLARLSTLTQALKSEGIFLPHTFVMDCEFQGRLCDLNRWSKFPNGDRHMCFTLEPNHTVTGRANMLTRYFVKNEDNEQWQKEFLSAPECDVFENGIMVSVHYPGTMPEINGGNFAIFSGFRSGRMRVEMTKTELYSTKTRPCSPKEDPIHMWFWNGESRTFAYSKEACEQMDLQVKLFRKCNCFSEMYPVPRSRLVETEENFPITMYCHHLTFEYSGSCSDSKTLLKPYSNLKITNSSEQMRNRFKCHSEFMSTRVNGEVESCPRLCVSYMYTFEFDSVAFATHNEESLKARPGVNEELRRSVEATYNWSLARNYSAEPLKRFLDDRIYRVTAKSLVNLVISTATPFGIRMKETLVYEFQTFISEVGGVSGLWTGLCVATLLELAELLENILGMRYRQWRRRKGNTSNTDQAVSSSVAQLHGDQQTLS